MTALMPPPGPSTLANRDKQNTTNIATDHKIKSSVPVHRDAVLAVESTTRVEHELHSEPHNVVEIFTVAELRTLLQDPRKASKAAAAAATAATNNGAATLPNAAEWSVESVLQAALVFMDAHTAGVVALAAGNPRGP